MEVELQNSEFKILDGQNLEFDILAIQNLEFSILAIQNLLFHPSNAIGQFAKNFPGWPWLE